LNYYNNTGHIIINASESYNNYLKNLFSDKPTFYKLLLTIQKEKFLSYNGLLKEKWRCFFFFFFFFLKKKEDKEELMKSMI